MAADSQKCETEGYDVIHGYHDEAYLFISQGLSYEEKEQKELACDMYRKGLEKMDKALNVRCDRSYCIGPRWDKARKLQQKMRKNMQTIKRQLEESYLSLSELEFPSNGLSESPPSYDEACEHAPSDVSFDRRGSCPNPSSKNHYPQLGNDLDTSISEVTDIFHIPDGVQLFYVSADGQVTTPSSPTSLHLYKFDDVGAAAEKQVLPTAWLQVGSWTYPLVPGQSPALESGYGAFIFPDVASEEDNAAVGVILPAEVDFDTRREFERCLRSLTAFNEQHDTLQPNVEFNSSAPGDGFGDTLSRGLVTGAEYLSAGIVKGATFTGEYIHKGATKLKENLQPDENPTTFDPRVKDGLKVAKTASGVALKFTGFLASKLADLTIALGQKMAPYIREQGTKMLTNTFKNDPQQAKDTVDGVIKVAAGGVQGFSAVYLGLENAARILAYSLSAETVNVVGHKYGTEAQEVVGNALFSVGNLALTTRNVQTLGVKSIAKRTAKDAGKAVLKDYVDQTNMPGPSTEAKLY